MSSLQHKLIDCKEESTNNKDISNRNTDNIHDIKVKEIPKFPIIRTIGGSSKLKTTDNIEVDINTLPLTEETGEILIDTSPTGKERNWALHKKYNIIATNILYLANQRNLTCISELVLFNMYNCANTLIFAIDENQKKRLAQVFFCRNRFCPMCQWRKSLKQFAQVSLITDYIDAHRDDIRYLFVTFTQKNVPADKLKSTIDKMNKAFSYLTSKSRTSAKTKKFKQSYLGHIKSIEITYNLKSNDYHPHIHCIFAVKDTYFNRNVHTKQDNYITYEQWRILWQDLMKLDYLPQIDVKAVKKSRQAKAVAELAKYPMKLTTIFDLPEDTAVEVLATLYNTCYGRRFVTYGGIFRDVKRILKLQDLESENVDLVTTENNVLGFNAVARSMYLYDYKTGVYINTHNIK